MNVPLRKEVLGENKDTGTLSDEEFSKEVLSIIKDNKSLIKEIRFELKRV